MAASVQQTFEDGQRATLELMARGCSLAEVLWGAEFSLYFPAAPRARVHRGVGGPPPPVGNPPGATR